MIFAYVLQKQAIVVNQVPFEGGDFLEYFMSAYALVLGKMTSGFAHVVLA